MKNIIGFAGTTSQHSINKSLVQYSLSLLKAPTFELLDLNDYELPLFSIDLENKGGYPENALMFDKLTSNCDGIILALAEHNGSYTAAFKNLFDWLSRINPKTWKNKPMLLMSSSPGKRGGKNVLEAAVARFPFHDSNIIETFSLPNFNETFKGGKIITPEYNTKLISAVTQFEASL